MEDIISVDEMKMDGRANATDIQYRVPGGMAFFAGKAIRRFDANARIALAGLRGAVGASPPAGVMRTFNTQSLYAVNGKRTNKSTVITDGTHRLIVRLKHEISFDADLTDEHRQGFMNLVSRVPCCLLGNLPLELTQLLIGAGRDSGTYVALGAGGNQLVHLDKLQPHALFLDLDEARKATNLPKGSADQVFNELLNTCHADHMVVMTGGGVEPTFVADVRSGEQWKIKPVSLETIPDRVFPAHCLGTGDTLAGTVTYLIGQSNPWPTGKALCDIVRFGQEVALLHLTESETQHHRVLEQYGHLTQHSLDSCR